MYSERSQRYCLMLWGRWPQTDLRRWVRCSVSSWRWFIPSASLVRIWGQAQPGTVSALLEWYDWMGLVRTCDAVLKKKILNSPCKLCWAFTFLIQSTVNAYQFTLSQDYGWWCHYSWLTISTCSCSKSLTNQNPFFTSSLFLLVEWLRVYCRSSCRGEIR